MKLFFILLSYLTSYKWKLIKSILNNDKCTDDIKHETKKIIFNNYSNLTKKITYLFINNNKKTVKNIKFNELNMYAMTGLVKAIDNYEYNSNYSFATYAIPYIKSDLYKGITDLTPLKLLPHHYRINNKWKKNNMNLYKKSMKTINTYGSDDWILDKYIENNKLNEYIKINDLVHDLRPELRRIFYYRYNKNMNIKKIAELMCFSDETIRKSLTLIHLHINYLLHNNPLHHF